jgi:anti-anti-sigma regulatory factor
VLEIQHDDAADVRVLEVRVASIEGDDALVLLRDVTEQKRRNEALEQQRAREEAVRLQAEALLSLATPLIPITDDIMVVPLVGELDPSRMGRVRAALSEGISTRGARIAILDMTGVPGITPAVAEEIVRVAQAARLLGSQMILTGIRSDVAQTLVALGQGLGNIATHRTLQSGIAFALAKR